MLTLKQRVRGRKVCKVMTDSKGDRKLEFSRGEWIRLFGLLLLATSMTTAATFYIVDLKINAAIANHSLSQIHQKK